MNVSGVGKGSQQAPYDCSLPLAFQKANSDSRNNNKQCTLARMKIPTIANSDLPLLLGLAALRKTRAIFDLNTLKIYFAGPGDYDLEKSLPPGTDVFQGELAPSGHLVLPCGEYGDVNERDTGSSLTLVSKEEQPEASVSPPPGLSTCFQ